LLLGESWHRPGFASRFVLQPSTATIFPGRVPPFLAQQNRHVSRSSTAVAVVPMHQARCAVYSLHRQGRDGRDLVTRKENTMSTIGSFTKHDQGFNGTLQTLAFNVKVKIVAIAKDNDKSPDYRVLAGSSEIGAAWKRQSNGNKEYLSVKLDDPSFPAPVNARLVETDNGTALLYWSRRGE
jgi:uncharacterized protein (DUF736 family)